MKRNGKIELMRFIFCVCILFNHLNADIWNSKLQIADHITFFRHGNIGVEYFFLISGALMAKSVQSRIMREETGQLSASASIGDETLGFLWHKLKSILPCHIVFSVPLLILVCSFNWSSNPLLFLDYFFSLFLLHRTGLSNSLLIGGEWYISSMLLCMALLYPLAKRHYKTFTHFVAPFCALLLLGYMNLSVGTLSNVSLVSGITYHCNYRALAELMLGMASYEISLVISRKTFTRIQQLLVSVFEATGYILTLLFTCSSLSSAYEFHVLFFLCISVTLSFSGKGLLSESKLFQNKICRYLGAISLPAYLSQNLVRIIALYWFSDANNLIRFLCSFAAILLLSVLYQFIQIRWNSISSPYKTV